MLKQNGCHFAFVIHKITWNFILQESYLDQVTFNRNYKISKSSSMNEHDEYIFSNLINNKAFTKIYMADTAKLLNQ